MIKILMLLTFLFFLSSCIQKKVGNFAEVKNEGVYVETDEFIVIGGEDRGEFKSGDESVLIRAKLTNKSEYVYKNVTVTLSEIPTSLLKYAEDLNGVVKYPGFGGNCTGTLSPQESCEVVLKFDPTIAGEITQNILVKYANLVETVEKQYSLKFFVGDSPIILELNSQRDYDFGAKERTLPQDIYEKEIILKNFGGLTARNLTLSMTNLSDNAFKLKEHNCPVNLKAGEECKIVVYFSSPNYQVSDVNQIFTANVLVDYIKSTANAKRVENGKFSYGLRVNSTKIEGILATNGATGLIFPDLIHGNSFKSNFQLKNTGSKELILRNISVYDALGMKIATCRRESSGENLTCFDPIQTHLIKNDLAIFPFRFKDSSSCLYNFENGSYSRNPTTGALIGSNVKLVNPATEDFAGDLCEVEVSFHASFNQTINTSYNGWSFGFEYDSTLLNLVNLYETSLPDTVGIKVIAANTVERGSLILRQAGGPNTNISNPAQPYVLDSKRVTALQSNSTYADVVRFVFKNTSLVAPIKVKRIYTTNESGVAFDITNTQGTLNNYYTSISLGSACKLNQEVILETCDVSFRYSPKLPISDLKNYGLNTLTQRERKFTLIYNDGCSTLDDGSPCLDKSIDFAFKSEIIARGGLEFNRSLSGASSGGLKLNHDVGAIKRTVAGNLLAGERGWFHLWITNIGSGSVKYLRLTNDASLLLPSSGILPFYIIPSTSGLGVGQHDCATFLRGTPAGDRLIPNGATIPVDFPAGESCRLTIETQLRNNEFASVINSSLWNLSTYADDPTYLEKYFLSTVTRNISFQFYDGDTTLPVASRTPNFLDNLGEPKIIAGGSNGLWQLRILFDYPGRLVPINPMPTTGAILFKPAVSYPAVVQDPKSQYTNGSAGFNIAAHLFNSLMSFTDSSFWVSTLNTSSGFPVATVTGLPSVPSKEIFHYLNLTSDLNYKLDFNDYAKNKDGIESEYVFYAGAYPVSTDQVTFSFLLKNTAAQGSALVSNIAETVTCIASPANCAGGNLQIVKTSSVPSNVYPNETTVVAFELNANSPTHVGRYESHYTVTMKTPIDRTIKIKVIADVIPADNKKISIETVDYNCISNDNGATCSSLTETNPLTNVSHYFNYAGNAIDSFYMRGVIASPLIHRKKFVITNTGTTPLYDFKMYLKNSASASLISYNNGTGGDITPKPSSYSGTYAANQYQCQTTGNSVKGILNVGDSCEIFINFRALSSATMEQAITYSYKILGSDSANDRNGVYLSQTAKIIFSSTNQANLVIFGNESDYKQLVYGGETVFSYPVKYKKYAQTNHPVLNSYPKTVFDSTQMITDPVVQIYNQRSEKASLLKQYENYMLSLGNPTPPAPSTTWTTIYKNASNGIEIQGGMGCFYGGDKNNPSVPADQKGFNDNNVVLNTGCLLKVLKDATIKEIGEIKAQSTVVELEYYSSLRIVSKKMYLHLEGFIEPYRSSVGNPVISDVISTDEGIVSFRWDPFLDEEIQRAGVNLDRIKHYRVFYSKKVNDLLSIHETSLPSTLKFADTLGTDPSIVIDNLSNGFVYYFRVMAIREIDHYGETIEYLSVGDGFLRNKIIVPDIGYAFDFETKTLIEKSVRPYSGNVTKSVALDTCNSEFIKVTDEAQLIKLQSKLITNDVFNIINTEELEASESLNPSGDLIYSDHNFTAIGTWINDVQDIGIIFNSSYNCSVASAFFNNDSIGYIKLCDNNNVDNHCCNVNVLNLMRGRPLSNKTELKTFYTNVSSLTAKFRCYADFSSYLQ